ncbi:MAG: ADP-glyceromanno-heptose 6-epimerase [Desulfovibrio sp.]|nr:ADP-glyceromanno-heptose 6-epimerase [Desulfovibrio sp.]MBR4742523.1 ADP-glyceromanno-heptose 6-epimerase [Desulfovibrio sp.]
MIVITGGAGFLGSALLWQLNQVGVEDILVVDNLASTEKWQNLVKRRFVDYMHRDRFRELLDRNALPNVSAVVHLGACSSTTEKDCDFLMENNFHYSQAICRYALDKGIRCIVASSAATYGDGHCGFSCDVDRIPYLKPLNMYGYSKQLLDLWLIREGGVNDVASLKFFNVYGPNEYHKRSMRSVVVKAFEEIQENGSLGLFASTEENMADGEQKRDFVYVKDCAALMAWLLETPSVCGIRNVGTGSARSFNDLGRAVFSAMNLPCSIYYKAMPLALQGKYQSYTCADMTWLTDEDCPVEFVSLEQGVSDYVQRYLSQKDPYL